MLISRSDRADAVTHVERISARAAEHSDWPTWADPRLVESFQALGVIRPWSHQAQAADLLHNGCNVVLATGTASGKSLGYLLPVLTDLLAATPGAAPGRRTGTALYLAPTKALAADQARRVRELSLPLPPPACLDGDTTAEERQWIRDYAAFVLSNPDMLHYSMLPDHRRWAAFLKRLRYVVIDECHAYRGVLGSHVAAVLRRLRRICVYYGAEPVFALASATSADPAASTQRLTGLPVSAITTDGSPRGEQLFALWEPPLTEKFGEGGAPLRRSAVAEAAMLLGDLVQAEVRTVAFVRSRRAAESVALIARRQLTDEDGGARAEDADGAGSPALAARIAAYRAGYLREDRRELEADLQSGRLLGVAATNALELGVDVSGLDAVLIAGYPGTRSSLWQQAGRAGRSGADALAVLIARDDPLDTYLVHHPETLFGQCVEATVLNPGNPYVLWSHLCAAAAELPLTESDFQLFGPTTPALVDELSRTGWLRARSGGWYWTRPERAADLSDLRGSGATPVRIVEGGTGRLLGQLDAAAAHTAVHAGAVYLHQGISYVVEQLDLDAAIATVVPQDPGYTTHAREVSQLQVVREERAEPWSPQVRLVFGTVEVTSRTVGYLRRDATSGAVLGEEPLTLPPRTLTTKAVWWTITTQGLETAGLCAADVPGAAHAAEHAAIGLLPLFAECDRWDIGGLSTANHPDTGLATVFVYDGLPGGSGFAERGRDQARAWLTATRDAIRACSCPAGCPSCVQSPKCGSGNQPLDKSGAIHLLGGLLGNEGG